MEEKLTQVELDEEPIDPMILEAQVQAARRKAQAELPQYERNYRAAKAKARKQRKGQKKRRKQGAMERKRRQR